MDKELVNYLHEKVRAEYPDLVRVLGEFRARSELEASLGYLVTNSVLDPIDAEEIYWGAVHVQ